MPLIDVTVASTDYYLTTTEAVKRALGSTATTSDDVRINACILAASRWAETYVGYPLSAQKYREAVAGFGTRSLIMARSPIRAVPALFDSATTDDAGTVATSEIQVEHGPGLIRRPQGWEWSVATEPWLAVRPLAGQEYPSWLADYVAGYTYGGIDTGSSLWSTVAGTTSTGRTLPEDIEQAVIVKAMGIFDGSDEVVEEQVGDLRVRYSSFGSGSGNEQPLDAATMLLAPYRRIA